MAHLVVVLLLLFLLLFVLVFTDNACLTLLHTTSQPHRG